MGFLRQLLHPNAAGFALTFNLHHVDATVNCFTFPQIPQLDTPGNYVQLSRTYPVSVDNQHCYRPQLNGTQHVQCPACVCSSPALFRLKTAMPPDVPAP
jgi:hypothetical protein